MFYLIYKMHHLFLGVLMASFDNWDIWVPIWNTVHWRSTADTLRCWSGPMFGFRSMSGHRVVPTADVHFYSATKYAVTALTEGLRQELHEAKTQIRATVRSSHSLDRLLDQYVWSKWVQFIIWTKIKSVLCLLDHFGLYLLHFTNVFFLVHFSWPCGDWISL